MRELIKGQQECQLSEKKKERKKKRGKDEKYKTIGVLVGATAALGFSQQLDSNNRQPTTLLLTNFPNDGCAG